MKRKIRSIRIRRACQNNLKNLDLEVQLGTLTVVTGVSGSGKSSLAFDTLYAEGQRRYVETFSAYTRQFLERMRRPDVESIDGIPAAVAIDQSGAVKTSRSTVGTMTGLNDYLKVLYARCATAVCPNCRHEVTPENTAAVVDFVRSLPEAADPVLVVAPLSLGGFESVDLIAASLHSQGYVRFLRDKEVTRIDDLAESDLKGEEIEIVVDRLATRRPNTARVADSCDQAFRLGRGSLRVVGGEVDRTFYEGVRCGTCAFEFPRPTPGLFSFNTPYGACPTCKGFGKTAELDLNRVIPDSTKSIRQDAIRPWATASRRRKKLQCLRFCAEHDISVDTPFEELSTSAQRKIIDGSNGFGGVRGFFERLDEKKYKMHVRVLLSRYRGYFKCGDCGGDRLRPEAFCFEVGGKCLGELWRMPVNEMRTFFDALAKTNLDKASQLIADEIVSRIVYLDSVGLGYLTLGRQSRTLSGGEVGRVNLTTALGASLVETLFVLDEPSIGLHARDNARLLEILRAIRDRGNTVIVVEHDPDILRAADCIIDLGPGAGEDGGELVAAGSVAEVKRNPSSLTGAYLSGRREIKPPERRRRPDSKHAIVVRGAHAHNLKNIDVEFPLGVLTAVTGVSGSGKSTLLEDVLYRGSRRLRGLPVEGDVEVERIEGLENVDEIVLVDQGPLGRTSRGNPATYIKVYNAIRDRFASTEQAKRARFEARHFSFNVEGGRCPECAGAGAIDVEMQFLSDVSLPCESCLGKRFKEDVLEINYRGINVARTLELTIREALEHFSDDPEVVDSLAFLDELGLGYLRLGQPLNTLSGGEAQRLKLAGRVLAARREKLLFLLDEPTTGLHLADVERLLALLQGLVGKGHSVIVIEHHLDVIRAADWVIDMGPEGGDGGGRVVACGSPEVIAQVPESITGRWIQGDRSDGSDELERTVSSLKRSSANVANAIRIVGARENNLKNVTVDLPRDQFVVVTGMSGSGKSSLLYDIVYAEGQRRYLDCLSPYARQFIEQLHRPDIDHLEGIPPTVAIEQRTTIGGRKSTVGTVSEVYQFLRLLYTRVGVQYCPECDVEVVPRSLEEIRNNVERLARRTGRLLAPAVRGKKGFHRVLLSKARRIGVSEARIDGKWVRIPRDRELRLDRQRAHDIDLVAGSFRQGNFSRPAIRDAIDLGLEFGDGAVVFLDDETGEETIFNRSRSCPKCASDFPEPDPRNFSFNSRHGACTDCDGFGTVLDLDPETLIADWSRPIGDAPGAIDVFDTEIFSRTARRRFVAAAKKAGIDPNRTPAELGARALKTLLTGKRGGFSGLLGWMEAALDEFEEDDYVDLMSPYSVEETCAACDGSRLRDVWAAVRVADTSIADVGRMTVTDLRRHFEGFQPKGNSQAMELIAGPIVSEILSRLRFLERLGLGYLGIDRRADTLSGGEAQRIRLASQLGSNLRGVCYVLDEPTIGLHGSDSDLLIRSLRELRDRGNSVLVIEHDEAAIAAADHIIDLGPGPGRHGGEVVASGPLEHIIATEASHTGRYFRERGDRVMDLSATIPDGPWISVQGARLHNLRNVTMRAPVGGVTVVTGVSGAGKSTLIRETLERGVRDRLRDRNRPLAGCKDVKGWEHVTAVREVDQKPIGRSPRSTPATYVGLWNSIRRIFASTPDAKVRGFGPPRFSFNVKGGRCERCAGQGTIKMEMNFLPDVRVDCDRCRGERFEPETLKATYHGKTIAEVLAMEVSEAREFFRSYRELVRPLETLEDLGLGYLTLGQASSTLSGGEAQRVKLALELSKSSRGGVLYLLDEPTIGLHMLDVANLAKMLRRLASRGHTVIVIEHHVELIAAADWLVELGPGGGDAGGRLLYQGPPRGIVAKDTPTGGFLAGRDGVSGASRSSTKVV